MRLMRFNLQNVIHVPSKQMYTSDAYCSSTSDHERSANIDSIEHAFGRLRQNSPRTSWNYEVLETCEAVGVVAGSEYSNSGYGAELSHMRHASSK